MRAKISWVALLLAACPFLMAQPHEGYLKAKVNPGRAGVFVDGKYVGPAANFRMARKYAVAPGKHEVKLIDPRYEETTVPVDVTAGKTTVISQTLKALPVPQGPFGILRVQNRDKYAAVYLNDKYYGHADEFSNGSQGMLLPPGEYNLRVEPTAGGNAVAQKVQITAGQTTLIK
ncbi:MAG: PEGA domain-containing protein [Acidobacteriia bacterium]|nr:PEGA domain-containing protein [Terriglobia bacterium]